MTDVVVKLRERVICSEYRKNKKPCAVVNCDCEVIEQAAKEIEKLRAKVAEKK